MDAAIRKSIEFARALVYSRESMVLRTRNRRRSLCWYGARQRCEKYLTACPFELCEFTLAAFTTSERKPRRSGGRKKLEMSLTVKHIFEACIQTQLYPRSQIDIFVQVLHADGGELPASINSITLALIDGGISLNEFVVAFSAGYLQQTMLCSTCLVL
ncbi:hypothetical protein PsorP6_012627 [Peronosclerospora sorghi]|uniref:Uncharacterized protein n=1 Tax=Peronosclerospora sorghi TaxID=230839 RepID=A0ACC0WGS8_9STRA|nr:hypothetical protein PsorP6_012627 [Peronosclerospora sorghi]